MAGSIKWFIYATDTGQQMGILQDEDWGESVGNTDVTTDPSGLYGIPMNLAPRYARYRAATGSRAIQIVVGDNTKTSDDLPASIVIVAANGEVSENVAENTMILTSFIGERYRPVISADTGMTDGDVT